ncbi:PREDICTED: uncharacterized protein LOC109476071 [Branchiostoma belcheri]|uniref:Uncharacterized protein LOC109476071 n=1 Tax=Branchiostoma belcheri TaxID=7741 RepID=A0A6P4ZS70_BRABE|nr:PREDICTED: uncharacterized protein LOC109476071 [Branchiostoma belcheri]
MATPPCLRADATFVGQDVVALVMRVRGEEPLPPEDRRARFGQETALHALDQDDLREKTKTLTGQDPENLLLMAGLDHKDHTAALRLAHFAIIMANEAAAAQPVQPAGKKAALAAADLLEDDPPPVKKSGETKRPAPPKASGSGQRPPPKKQRKAPAPDTSSESSDSDEDDLEEDGVEAPLRRLKRICQDPLIHHHPERLKTALSRVTKAAKEVQHKRYKRFKQVKSFFLRHTSVPGIGQSVRKMVMTKEEKQFAEEAERAAAAFQGHGRGGVRATGTKPQPSRAEHLGPPGTPHQHLGIGVPPEQGLLPQAQRQRPVPPQGAEMLQLWRTGPHQEEVSPPSHLLIWQHV